MLLRRADLGGMSSDGPKGQDDAGAGCFWLTWYAFDACLSEAQSVEIAGKQCAALESTRLDGFELLDACAPQGYHRVRSHCCPVMLPAG